MEPLSGYKPSTPTDRNPPQEEEEEEEEETNVTMSHLSGVVLWQAGEAAAVADELSPVCLSWHLPDHPRQPMSLALSAHTSSSLGQVVHTNKVMQRCHTVCEIIDIFSCHML